jgi:hypothetical protein
MYVYKRSFTSRLLPPDVLAFASLLEGPDFGDCNRLANAPGTITLNEKLRMYEGYLWICEVEPWKRRWRSRTVTSLALGPVYPDFAAGSLLSSQARALVLVSSGSPRVRDQSPRDPSERNFDFSYKCTDRVAVISCCPRTLVMRSSMTSTGLD